MAVPQRRKVIRLCGDSGQLNENGVPCGNRVKRKGAKCAKHGGVGLAKARIQQERFLKHFARLGTITHASRQAKLDPTSHSGWMTTDPTYPERFEKAVQAANDELENEARRRAVIGVTKPILHKGEVVETVQEYSDTLLIVLMKGGMPEKYRERYDARISADAPIPVAVYIPDNNRMDAPRPSLGSGTQVAVIPPPVKEDAEGERADA